MYISASIDRRDSKAVKSYLAVAAFCAFFALVYAQFSHDVHSPFMTFAFCIPLIGGAGVFASFRLLHIAPMSRFSFNAYNASIATFAVASILRGVFEIAGTSSGYLLWFVVAGMGLLVAAGAGMLVHDHQSKAID